MARREVALVGLLILLVPGCLSGAEPAATGPRLATPTDKPAVVPVTNNKTATSQAPDFTDVGYLMGAPWSVGDRWDYVSNQSHMRITKVLREAVVGGVHFVLVEESDGWYNMSPQRVGTSWVSTQTLERFNTTYSTGFLSIEYEPSRPDRFHRNGSFQYNHTEFTSASSTKYQVRANSFYAGLEKVPLVFDRNTMAGRVEHRILKTDSAGNPERLLELHFPHRLYGNDVQFQLPSGELYRLVYFKYGNLEQGTPVSWPEPDDEEDEFL